MLTVPQAAALWHASGVSTVPIMSNGTKRPVVRWAEYQVHLPELGDIERWWGNGHDYGLAVICGAVSGNLEMTELEADAALDSEKMARLESSWIWQGLFAEYAEWTPSGGLHLIYRITGHPVPGNEKVARRQDGKVLVETRGEGGYVIVAPTSGLCHPSGESWNLLNGYPGRIPEISWDEREQLHELLREVYDEFEESGHSQPPTPSVAPVQSPLPAPYEGVGSRPGDEWAERMSWADILEPVGWTRSHSHGVEEFWVRPGKPTRDGHSATTNYQNSNLLKVFTTSVRELDTDATYTKFGAYAALHHRGDFREAARELAKRGFGTPHVSPRAGNEVEAFIEEDDNRYTLDDVGNGQRMLDEPARYFPEHRVRDIHRWSIEEKAARYWDGAVWVRHDNAIFWESDAVTHRMLSHPDEAVRKHASRSRSGSKQREMVKAFFTIPGMSVSTSDFDAETKFLNLQNGVYDLDTATLHPHSPEYLITRRFNASYDPDAKAPLWEQFLDQALPDPELRAYVQRCLGYTLLGDPSERAMFIVHGPSGTGKSTFLETLNHVFGDYGETAPSGTFRAQKDENASSSSLGLHGLRGKRFVTTSETSEGVQWNEELVKRYTGHDLMRTRGLYETFQTWRSEASIWMATNHAPRFTSDDRAIWNRVKLVPFMTVFVGDGQVLAMDSLLMTEANGILNWLLQGLAEYRRHGLGEPASVTNSVHLLREQSDSVVKFLDDKLAEGALNLGATLVMQKPMLYQMYMSWCRLMGERAVGGNRFLLRLKESGRPIRVSEDGRTVTGVGRSSGGWLT